MIEFKSGDIIEYVRPDQFTGPSKERPLCKRLLRKLDRDIFLKGNGVPYITTTANGELSSEGSVGDWYLEDNKKLPRSIKYNNKYAVMIWWFYGIIFLIRSIYNYFSLIIEYNLGETKQLKYPNVFVLIIYKFYLLNGTFPSSEVLKRLDIKHSWISI